MLFVHVINTNLTVHLLLVNFCRLILQGKIDDAVNLSISFILLFVFTICSNPLFSQASFQEKLTTASNIRMTVDNLGLIGNCFSGSYTVDGYPSCVYPANSGIEHLFEGGLWVGAYVNGQPLVTTGAVDDATGYTTGKPNFEFTATIWGQLIERSNEFDNPNYSPSAISQQDFVSDFSDTNIIVPGTNIQIAGHNPLGISVHFESYNWNYSFANFFDILHFVITNKGLHGDTSIVLDSIFVGYWADLVVRNTNITPAGQGGAQFYNKGGNGYLDSLLTGFMAYCFDAAGDTAYTKSYIGIKYLGSQDKNGFHHPLVDNSECNYNVWEYNTSTDPIYFSPTDDNSRYGKLSLGLNDNPALNWPSVSSTIRKANNRADLIAAGPYHNLQYNETIDIAFAVVCAPMFPDGNPVYADTYAQKTTLIQNAGWAQRCYDGEDVNFNGKLDPGEDKDHNGVITRYILPTPPDVPRTKVIPGDTKIDIYWSNNAENAFNNISGKKDFEGYNIYKTDFGFDVTTTTQDVQSALKLIKEYDKAGDSVFYNTGFGEVLLEQPVKFDNDTTTYYYKYTINNVQDGWQHAVSVTAFDTGDKEEGLESLESSQLANLIRAFPGKPSNTDLKKNHPFVYPNPYYASAMWEGADASTEDGKLIFSNLPANSTIRIYTTAGDVVKVINHNASTYNGSDINWFQAYGDTSNSVFSGGEHAWDLLSSDQQIIARGLYIYSVEDRDSGKEYSGKFAIIK